MWQLEFSGGSGREKGEIKNKLKRRKGGNVLEEEVVREKGKEGKKKKNKSGMFWSVWVGKKGKERIKRKIKK